MRTSWPLVGRADELAAVRGLIGRRRSVVLAGPPGVGKTRLAEEALALAAQGGAITATIHATQASRSVVLGAMAPLLPASVTAGTTVEVIARAREALLARTGRNLVLLVDDAHLLDDASATLCHQLAFTGAALIVMTMRTGVPVPDAITGLWKEGTADRLDLKGLDRDGIGAVLSEVLGGSVDGAAAFELATSSDGNLLFLHELVLAAQAAGALTEVHGTWGLTGPLHVSDRLSEVVEHRLSGLSDDDRAGLEVLTLGEPLPLSAFEELSAPGTAERLDAHRLLLLDGSGSQTTVRLAHPVHGDVVRSTMSALRARAISRTLAERAEAQADLDEHMVLRTALWRLDASGTDGHGSLARGAQVAFDRSDFALATRLGHAALERAPEQATFELRLTTEWARSLSGEPAEASTELEALLVEAGDDEQVAAVAVALSDIFSLSLGQPHDGVRVADDALRRVRPGTAAEVEVQVARIQAVALSGRYPEAFAALAGLGDRVQGRALVHLGAVIGPLYAWHGQLQAAIDVTDRAQAARRQATGALRIPPSVADHTLAQAYFVSGLLAEAEELARRGYELSLQTRNRDDQGNWCAILMHVAMRCGRLEDAIAFAREGVVIHTELGGTVGIVQDLYMVAECAAMRGQAGEARQALADAEAYGLTMGLLERRRLHSLPWIQAAEGDLPGARQTVRELIEQLEPVDNPTNTVRALHILARLGCAAEVRDRVVALSEGAEGPAAPAVRQHVVAAAAGDGEGLDAASAAFEDYGALLLAAEASADAAVAWQKATKARKSSASSLRAHALTERCQGARTPALTVLTARVRLTDAERTMVHLAAGGRSNREIADQLVISVRTVENTLSRAFIKLGISRRGELAEALAQV